MPVTAVSIKSHAVRADVYCMFNLKDLDRFTTWCLKGAWTIKTRETVYCTSNPFCLLLSWKKDIPVGGVSGILSSSELCFSGSRIHRNESDEAVNTYGPGHLRVLHNWGIFLWNKWKCTKCKSAGSYNWSFQSNLTKTIVIFQQILNFQRVLEAACALILATLFNIWLHTLRQQWQPPNVSCVHL